MQRSVVKRFNPLIIIPVFLAKKVTVYKLAESYGFHLVYRRLCEGIKLTVPVHQQLQTRHVIKEGFRSPTKIFYIINDSHVATFIKTYSQLIVEKSPVKVPPFMVTLAEMMLKETGVGKIWNFLASSSSKAKK